MDWLTKGILTALTVALLLAVARMFGRRIAGVLAGLPTVTGPALVWLEREHGTVFATEAAIGSVAACALCAVFALVYERASRGRGVVAALGVSVAASLVCAPSLQWLAGALAPALLVAAIVSPAVQAALPCARETRERVRLRGEVALTAVASGAVTSTVALCASSVGPFWTGVLASPPLVAAAIVMHQHHAAGHPAVCRFLDGYVGGLFGRAVFGAAFAMLVIPFGIAVATIAASLVGGALGVGASCIGRSSSRAAPAAAHVAIARTWSGEGERDAAKTLARR